MNSESATVNDDSVLQCASKMETISLGGEQLSVPACLLEDVNYSLKILHTIMTRLYGIQSEVFSEVLSESTWNSVLTEAERARLEALLPQTKAGTLQPDRDMLKWVIFRSVVQYSVAYMHYNY